MAIPMNTTSLIAASRTCTSSLSALKETGRFRRLRVTTVTAAITAISRPMPIRSPQRGRRRASIRAVVSCETVSSSLATRLKPESGNRSPMRRCSCSAVSIM